MYGVRNLDISPLLPTPWVTLADVKAFIGVADTGSDALLTAMLATAVQQTESYCGAYFSARTVTETMYPEDPLRTLVLGTAPVVTLTSLTFDDGAAENLISYTALLRQGMLKRVDGSALSARKMVAVYTVGYSGASDPLLPAPLVQAVKEYVRDLYNTKDRVAGIVSESVTGIGSITYSASSTAVAGAGGARVPDSVAALLAPYKRDFA